jgi:hypothetical protein
MMESTKVGSIMGILTKVIHCNDTTPERGRKGHMKSMILEIRHINVKAL